MKALKELKALWAWFWSDSGTLLVSMVYGMVRDRPMLVGFAALGLLIIKYGHKKETP
jgi:hypothetical protein